MGNDWIDLDINKLLHITGKKSLALILHNFMSNLFYSTNFHEFFKLLDFLPIFKVLQFLFRFFLNHLDLFRSNLFPTQFE